MRIKRSIVASLLSVIFLASQTLYATETPPQGLYSLQQAMDFNVLDSVTIDPETGRITMVGHRDPIYGDLKIPYLDHLAEFLLNPSPEFSFDWTPESGPRVEALFRNFNSEEYVRSLARQWGQVMDENGRPTGPGRWLLPVLGVKPTYHGNRLGYLGADVREITQVQRNTYQRLEITSVAPGSAAELAGLRVGDVISNYANSNLFVHSIRLTGEGGQVMLQIIPSGQTGANIVNVTLGGRDGDPWAELDKFDIVRAMISKTGNDKGAMLISQLSDLQKIVLGSSHAGFQTAFDIMVAVAGYNDGYWQDVAEYNAGRMNKETVLARAYHAIYSALDDAFSFYDRPLTTTFDNAIRNGSDSGSAFDQALLVLNQRIEPYLTDVMKSLMAAHQEIQIPPDVLAQTAGTYFEVTPDYRGVDPHSALARLLYESDYLGKSLINMPSLSEKIPAYQTDFAFERNNPDKSGPWHATADYHLWFSIQNLDLAQTKDGNTLLTRGAKMRYDMRQKKAGGGDLPAVQDGYDVLLTSLYDDFAREFPVLHELREAAKIAAVAAWLKSKDPGFSMPRAGRISWTGPTRAPGFLYLTWSPQERPGHLVMALSAMGGGSMDLVRAPKYIIGPAEDNLVPVVDLSKKPSWGEKISNMPDGSPAPQPLGWVNKGTKDGQDVSAVSFLPVDEKDAPAGLKLESSSDGMALWKAGDLEGAEKALTDELAKATKPRDKSNILMMLAQILHEKGDEDEAIKKLEEAVRIDPNNPMLHLLIAKEKYDYGDVDGAKEALRQYIAMAPDNKAAAELLAKIESGMLEGGTAPQTVPSVPGGPTWDVNVPVFTPSLDEAAAAPTSPLETAVSGRKSLLIYQFKYHGMPHLPEVPPALAETKGWKTLETERTKLRQSYDAIEAQLEKEVRAKRTAGQGKPQDLDKLEAKFQKQQQEVRQKIDNVTKKMTQDIVTWNTKEEKKP